VNKENPVSSTPTRPRLARVVLGVVMGAVVLAGCGTGQGSASSYDDMEDAFMEGCEATAADDAAESDAAALPDDFCRCAFDALSGEGEGEGVEFDTLMDINADFTEEPARLPDEVVETFADCA
jgi:uncharacterized protein YgiB involved in biofilm formation